MAEKKSIAFVISSLSSGGAERVVSTLSNELINNYNVTIITFIDGQPFYKLNRNVKVLSCFDIIAPSTNILQAIKVNYLLFKKISSFLKSENVNLVIGFMTSSNILAVMAAKSNKIPVMISERINPFSANTSFIWRKLRNYFYPKANYLIVQTDTIKKYYAKKIKKNRLQILANPLASDLTNNRKILKSKEKVVLNVGRHTKQKAQNLLIKAFATINPEGWQLHIVGRGPLKTSLEALIDSLNMNSKIKLLPPSHHIDEHYNKSTIFAFTSIFEGFPNALTEAMHFGLACIATNCPTGPSELITDGENGFLIPMNNQAILQKRLQQLMDDEALQRLFGENAMTSVEKYEAHNVAKSWQNLIEKALIQGSV